MGKVIVQVQDANRIEAIKELAKAIGKCADALCATPQVALSNCNITNADTGISINTAKDIYETTIDHIENDPAPKRPAKGKKGRAK